MTFMTFVRLVSATVVGAAALCGSASAGVVEPIATATASAGAEAVTGKLNDVRIAQASSVDPKPEKDNAVLLITPSVPPPIVPTIRRQHEEANDPCGDSTRLLASLNRPTVGYSTCTVPVGSAVFEEGYQINAQGGPAASVSSALVQGFQRYGVAPRLEVDFLGPTYNRTRDSSGVSKGFSDLGIGFKYQLQQKTKVQYAIDGLFTAATGSKSFSAGGRTEQFNLDIAYPLSSTIGIGTTLGLAATMGSLTNSSTSHPAYARYGTFIPSLVVTDQVNHLTQFYAEYVNPTKISPDLGARAYGDFGLQRLLGQYMEVDIEYGVSFTPIQGSRFHYVGLGLGVWRK